MNALPTKILPLVGLRIQIYEPSDNFWRLAIYLESDSSEPLNILHHESQDTIKEWAIKLNEQA